MVGAVTDQMTLECGDSVENDNAPVAFYDVSVDKVPMPSRKTAGH